MTTSRQQDEWAEWFASHYGRCAVLPLPNGAIIAQGMSDDTIRVQIRIEPGGRCSSASKQDLADAEQYAARHERRACWRCGYPNRVSLAVCARCGSPAHAPDVAA